MKTFVLSLSFAICASAVSSHAALTALDSSQFANKFNGTDLFDGTNLINDWATDGGATNFSLNGNNLVLSVAANNGWIQHDTGSTPWEQGAGSWTVEARALVGANSGSGGFTVWGALNGERNIMTVREGSVTDLGGTVYSSSDNTDGFHDFRLVYDADDDSYHYFRDGLQITPDGGIGQQASTGNTRLILGDCCSNIGGSPFGGSGTDVEFEYVRYDNSGAFSPIPEPSTAALSGLFGLGFLLRRRR